MLLNDALAAERGGDIGSSTVGALVRGGLLDSLLDSGLLPAGALSQVAPPADTSIFWIDTTTNPRTLKRHNGTAWVGATFADVYGFQEKRQVVELASLGFISTDQEAPITSELETIISSSTTMIKIEFSGSFVIARQNRELALRQAALQINIDNGGWTDLRRYSCFIRATSSGTTNLQYERDANYTSLNAVSNNTSIKTRVLALIGTPTDTEMIRTSGNCQVFITEVA